MPALNDLISLNYAKDITGIARGVSKFDARLAALITACSIAAANYCGRKFIPSYYDELYNGSGQGFLVMRQSPLIAIDSVVIGPSTSQPQVYDSTAFDIEPPISKIAFKPTEVADFFYGVVTNLAFPSGINTVEAKYFGGYGAIITSATAVPTTGAHTLSVDSVYGVTANGDQWGLIVGSCVIADPGLATEELAIVTSVSSSTLTAVFARPHIAGFRVAVPQIPSDLQMAVGFMVSNLHKQQDLTKQSERLDQYSYTLRPNQYGVIFTGEVQSIINRYKSAFAG